MALVCAISGEVPAEPVVSPVSGAVFERRLIEKHLASSGMDPTNEQPLSVDQLIAIAAPQIVRPRPPSATSIPALLKLFQDEWDSVMLETFKMRQNVETARQELSHALYQHDAACRVIARLTRERDQARNALATLQPSGGAIEEASGDVAAMEGVEGGQGLPAAVVADIAKTGKTLSKARKKRAKPAETATAEDIAAFSVKETHPGLHSASKPGLTALDVHPSNDKLVITGGMDKNAVVFDRESEKIVATLKGHTKKVTGVMLHPSADIAVTSSMDNTVRVWSASSGAAASVIKAHTKAVNDISLHPSGNYVLSCSQDDHWALSDINSGTTLATVTDASFKDLTSAQFHPDGLIFAVGSSTSVLQIWDSKEHNVLANFEGHTGAITSIAFSENGYHLATASADSTVKLWDLRKLHNFASIDLSDGYQASSLHFDHSGSFLAVGGTDVRVYGTKQWELIRAFEDHSAAVTAVRFGSHARCLLSTSMDRCLKVFA